MRFVIDNALSPSISASLKSAGYDCVHVRELRMAASPDQEIFTYAEQENRILVSADTDFGALLASTGRVKPSVILFRRTNKRPLELAKILIEAIKQLSEELETGSIAVIEDQRIRVRRLPIL
jgi:predicted nuclease of predicted toxin-antitoxin system